MGWVTVRKRDRGYEKKRAELCAVWENRRKNNARKRERERERELKLGKRVNARHAIYAVPINHPAANFCTDSRHRLPRVADRRDGTAFLTRGGVR